ncbi:CRTAC1 family protein [Engelhardtia mirabilis]|uniref:CRTAC1 family protein n=1 Tax=Engelhardtia mirabilis TaxID=2528011 RepID=UPI003AF3F8C5
MAHSTDERVLLIDGEPRVVGPPELPPRVGYFDAKFVALIAYQDGETAEQGLEVFLETPTTVERPLILVPGPAPRGTADSSAPQIVVRALGQLDERTIPFGCQRLGGCGAFALVLPEGRHRLSLVDSTIDQLFVADVRVPRDPTELEVTLDPQGAEVRVAIPPRDEGRTWTLLVDAPRGAGPPRPGDEAPVASGALTIAHAREGDSDVLVDMLPREGPRLVHFEGPDEQLDIRPTMGPGIAWGDVDDDGTPELYVVQGGGREGTLAPTNRMFQWDGEALQDITMAAGAADTGNGMGALFFDGDGDGSLDLYVANYGEDVLYGHWNSYHFALGGGFEPPAFSDVTAAAGITGDRWSAGVAAADPDRDGDLDLYVTSYLTYDPALMPPVEDLPLSREDPIEMLPFAFPGQRNVYYRNESTPEGMRFVDATEELGLLDEQGRGMQPLFFDFDADGAEDLYVANDVSFNVLWSGDGEGHFHDVSFQTGMDDPRGGMGVNVADVDGDLDEDLFLTNWQLEANALYRNNRLSHRSQRHRVATFRDVTVPAGFGPHSVGFTSWGCEFFDLDLDGDLDLFVANGYTSPDYESTGICVGQPNHLFVNDGEARFTLVEGLTDVDRALPSRAVVACDFDRDGDEDLVVTTNNGPLQLLENRATDGADRPSWLGIELRGADGNTRAIGARVTVTVGDLTQLRSMRAGRSYLGGNPPELLFGFGEREGPATVEIQWPSGATSSHTVELDQWTRIAEPESE